MEAEYLNGLNPEQRIAVEHFEGPILTLAGAGSGKTRVLTTRITHLINEHGVDPSSILAVTFTNKAAAEMRERAKQLVGPRAAKNLVISTFHSLGVRILRSEGERLGLKQQFSILDSDDVLGLLKEAGGSTDNALARRWQWAISLWKNQGLNSEQAEGAAAEDVAEAGHRLAGPTGGDGHFRAKRLVRCGRLRYPYANAIRCRQHPGHSMGKFCG